QPFSSEAVFKLGKAGDVAAGPRHAFDKPRSDWIDDLRKHYRGCRGCLQHRREHDIAGHEDNVRRERGDLRRKLLGTGSVERGPTIFDANIASHGPARGLQRLLERRTAGNRFRIVLGESNDDADEPHPLWLLRPRRHRPRRRPAQPGDEFAPVAHSITSSARPGSGRGTARPRALAVLRLMISSTFTTCWTGRSAGLSPFRIRPV